MLLQDLFSLCIPGWKSCYPFYEIAQLFFQYQKFMLLLGSLRIKWTGICERAVREQHESGGSDVEGAKGVSDGIHRFEVCGGTAENLELFLSNWRDDRCD